MTNHDWRRATVRLATTCALIAACGSSDDDPSGGDTDALATTTGASTSGPPQDGSDGSGSEASGSDASTDGGGTSGTGSTGAETTDDASDSEGSTGDGALEIAGEWLETFPGGGDQSHTITDASWSMSSEFGDSLHHIDAWDSRARALVAQSDAANAFNPGLWGKFEWQWVDDALYYCQSTYDAASADAAWSAPGAEPSDLELGCGGFAWSRLDPA